MCLAAVAAVSFSACSSDKSDSAQPTSASPASITAAPAMTGTMNHAADLVGPGCADYAALHPDGPASVNGMAQDPVATAASNNPLLSTLTAALSGKLNPGVNLVDTLNSAAYHGVAYPFLVELARDPGVRKSLYTPLLQGTRDEKINLARVMARSGDKSDAPQLEKLSHDADPEVAQEGLRALRNLQART